MSGVWAPWKNDQNVLVSVKSLRNISTSKEKIRKLWIFMRKNQKTLLRESNLYPRTDLFNSNIIYEWSLRWNCKHFLLLKIDAYQFLYYYNFLFQLLSAFKGSVNEHQMTVPLDPTLKHCDEYSNCGIWDIQSILHEWGLTNDTKQCQAMLTCTF